MNKKVVIGGIVLDGVLIEDAVDSNSGRQIKYVFNPASKQDEDILKRIGNRKFYGPPNDIYQDGKYYEIDTSEIETN